MKGLAPGDKFGDYTVVRRLGSGGMGEVWLLRSQSGTEVAAKILDPESSSDHVSRRRFLREAELAIGMRHPHLVETYDVGEDPDTGLCYILMEYVSGGTLADWLKANGAMKISDAVAVLRAIASVLELGRQKGIVHRDIKPANIMFAADGTPKLADLGIARGKASDAETTTVTRTGVMIGTPAYMAPEQMLDSHRVDTRADIYSLGVVFFEMLTGERPNKEDTVIQLMAKAVKGEPLPDVRTLRPDVSASIAQLLNMMVVPDRDGRISTPGQVASAVDAIQRAGRFDAALPVRRPSSRALVRAPAASAPQPQGKSFPWLALGFAVSIATLAGALFMVATKEQAVPSVVQVTNAVVHTDVVERVVQSVKVVTNDVVRAADGRKANAAEARGSDSVQTAAADSSHWTAFRNRRRHKGATPAPGWITVKPNGMFDARITAESDLSGGGNVERAICLYHPLENQYQSIRWYAQVPKEWIAVMPETRDRYIRIADKGRHLRDVDFNGEFNVSYNAVKVDFSKIDGTVPYDKTTFEYKTYTRDWRSENRGRVCISLSHPWIRERRDEILAAVGDDHIDYAYRVYALVSGEFSLSRDHVGISEAIKRKCGSEIDVVSVFVSLLRAAGIPSRILCGKKVDGGLAFVPEFYLEGCGWAPASLLKDVGKGEASHFGVYDEACALVCSDIDVTIQGARGDGDDNHFNRFFMAWWWWVSGQWTPCDTRMRWSGKPTSEAAVAKRMAEAKAPKKKTPQIAGKVKTTVVFPMLDRSPTAWAYSFDEEKGWNEPGFDDSGWKRAQGGFGSRESSEQNYLCARLNTIWNTKRIFLRKRFKWNGGDVSRILVQAFHDDDMTIWLNGRLMLTVNNSYHEWQTFEIPTKRFSRALKEGENIFCVEVVNNWSVGYFDCGLAVECGGEAAEHAGPDGVRRVKSSEGTWTVVVEDGVAQIGNGRDVALDPQPKGTLRIPAALDGLRIRRLAENSFRDCGELEGVEIPEGMRSVGSQAFFGCARLAKVEVPSSLDSVGTEAFHGAGLLKRLDLKNVLTIEGGAFKFCDSLDAVTVSPNNPRFRVKDGILYDKQRRAVVFCPRSRDNYVFPSGVEEVCSSAFHYCALTRIVIPNSVQIVGHCAFERCPRLESVVFKGEDAVIGGWAFGNLPSLRTLVLPSRLKNLGEWAVVYNAGQLDKVVLPDTLEVIGESVFGNCRRLSGIEFGDSLRKVSLLAFENCVSLKAVKFPSTLKEMGAEVFLGCKGLKAVVFTGNAPVLSDRNERLGCDLYRDANPLLVTFVQKGTKGWKDDTAAIPKKWPVGAGGSARAIRHAK